MSQPNPTKSCDPERAKKHLRRLRDLGGYDGYACDEYECRIAQCIDDLQVALRSQIEITNMERARKEELEHQIAETRAKAIRETAERCVEICVEYSEGIVELPRDSQVAVECGALIAEEFLSKEDGK